MENSKKKRLRHLLAILGLFILFALGAFKNQDDNLIQKIVTHFKFFNQNYLQEKLYLHLDKPYYGIGEDMWYKAYLVNGTSLTPDSTSKNVYVELVSPDGEIVQKHTLKVKNGFAAGDFSIADSLQEGTYSVRAYTNWMRNFSDDYFFKQDIPIWKNTSEDLLAAKGTTRKNTSRAAEGNASPALDVQFFPESGSLIAGIKSKIAFKAIDGLGKGIDITGNVVDEAGKEIAAFKSSHLGMGSFMFTPAYGTNYTVRVKAGTDNQPQKFSFPQVQERGIIMQVNNFPQDMMYVSIVQNIADNAADKEVVFIGQSRGVICYASKASLTGTSSIISIPKEKFPAGIAQLNLFDAATGEPLCERLVFISNQQDKLNLSIKSNKTSYKPRELVQLDITATDQKGNPAVANLSLAVTEAAVQHKAYARNLYTYLLLSSDLQGTVEQPGYYFKDQKISTLQALDNLMLTQGWRRFVWEEILAGKFPKINYGMEQSLSVSGQVNHLSGNKPWPNSDILLYLAGKDPVWIQTKTDEKGRFFADQFDFYGKVNLIVQARNEKGSKHVSIVLDKHVSPPLPARPDKLTGERPPFIAAYLDRAEKKKRTDEAYAISKGEHLLKEVVVEGKEEEDVGPGIIKMYGTPDNTIKMDDLGGSASSYQNILQPLQGRVAGVQVFGTGPEMAVSIRGGGTPLFLFDGVEVELDMISSINPAIVETIDVLKGPAAAVYGARGSNGVIAIYTRRGPGNYGSQQEPGFVTTSLAGYYKAREFYAPKYNVKKEAHALPDMRSTLFWSPEVITDANGKATVTFYNADNVDAMRVVAEGITNTGLIGTETKAIGTEPREMSN
ncbi:TonB-dependent receptor plug domain-containing protein [Pontibacter sp. 172403-2]|uniref:TonB-dependent receptor plug domain-containing protein n=1 Tax=Pontibacter rufus TaxID=2791028 RepID=UPI0018AF7BBA|nr:TonB-dependent receptor plug domain-containing protein [Pontibacter sp. 172403-2]MBF9255541.1 TonB-dependent receptor plug domain-containing protein [Pontibacter sp. 172403-2]